MKKIIFSFGLSLIFVSCQNATKERETSAVPTIKAAAATPIAGGLSAEERTLLKTFASTWTELVEIEQYLKWQEEDGRLKKGERPTWMNIPDDAKYMHVEYCDKAPSGVSIDLNKEPAEIALNSSQDVMSWPIKGIKQSGLKTVITAGSTSGELITMEFVATDKTNTQGAWKNTEGLMIKESALKTVPSIKEPESYCQDE